MKCVDLKGQRFGKLLVIERSSNSKTGKAIWKCRCDCGNEKDILADSLRRGTTKSCGCLQRELVSKRRHKHGLADTRLYKVWRTMKERCYTETYRDYKHYGGRGIKVCDEWLDDFMNFYNWAMANGYNENAKRGEHTIDRIDVNGNYEPSNCRLVNMNVQANNVRTNHLITYNDKTQSISRWADEVGISAHTISNRLKIGWSVEKALTTKVMKGKK